MKEMFNLFIQSIVKGYKFDIKTKATRKEYLSFLLGFFAVGLGAGVLSGVTGADENIVSTLLILFIFLPELFIGWRRCNDLGIKSHYYIIAIVGRTIFQFTSLINLAFVINIVMALIFAIAPSKIDYQEKEEVNNET